VNELTQNDPSSTSSTSGLFGMNLYYNIENQDLYADAQWNGNISWIEWSVPFEPMHQYGFTYDPTDRLTNAKYRGIDKKVCQEVNPGAYDVEIMGYDPRGNIGGLKRYGHTQMTQGGPLFGLIDNLDFSYNGNKLTNISESAISDRGYKGGANSTLTYQHGNVKTQGNKSITNIKYNFLNLPEEIAFPGGKIVNYYDANGIKLKTKIIKDGEETVTRYYMDGIEYEGNEADGVSLQAFYHPEGRIVFDGELETIDGIKNKYAEFVIRDHLGNTRVRFVDKDKNGELEVIENDSIANELIGSYHYYPFGMEMEGEWNLQQGLDYDYQYNGKELASDLGLDWLDYGARFYDPSIARWTSIDPLADTYHSFSPFNYVLNNPVKNIDPDGMRVSLFDRMEESGARHGKAAEESKSDESTHMESSESDDQGDPPYIERRIKKRNSLSDEERAEFDQDGLKQIEYLSYLVPLEIAIAKGIPWAWRIFKTTRAAKASGQAHHLLGTKITRALNSHPTLKGAFDYNRTNSKYIYDALDDAAHKGYQTWHRQYDATVVKWLQNNPAASPTQFDKYLHNLHQQPLLKSKIPNVNLK